MIRIDRGAEPAKLAMLRAQKLVDLRNIKTHEGRDPKSDEIDGYRIVADDLWVRQFKKCCYCEMGIPRKRQDVEHYRPKAEANRGEYFPTHGYWWLAFTWENLLYSCQNCNQGIAKGVQFPLKDGSVPLVAEQQPHRGERPLLIDPATECGIEHIEFILDPGKKWRPIPRNGSAKGAATIRVCDLDRDDLLGLYTGHVNRNVRVWDRKIKEAFKDKDDVAVDKHVSDANRALLRRSQPFVGLSYDALRHFVPDAELKPFGLSWHPPA